MEVTLMKLKYDRVVDTTEIPLTDSNYQDYGYLKDDTGYYKIDSSTGTNEKVYFTEVAVDVTEHYEHDLPNPSAFDIVYSDVDKEGSGRNESDGLMQRERIGHYQSINVQWNIIPNSIKRINLVRILKHLPPDFVLEYHDSQDEINTTREMRCYRADISENLFLFFENKSIWQGLSTQFIQYDVTPYDDSEEPTLL